MKKKLPNTIPLPIPGIEKLLMIMKLALIIVFLSVLQVSAKTYSQVTVNLDFQGKPIREVLKSIEKQSQVRFFYSDDLMAMNDRISVYAENRNIINVLDDIFADTKLTYKKYDNDLIVIAPREFLQQQVRVTGTIIDAGTSEPLVGVNVVLEGTTIGVMTDVKGKFTLNVPDLTGALQFSYIGYVAQRIPINGQTVIDIKLASDLLSLDEVVVTGYGTVKRSDLTGSVSSIKTEQLLQLPTQRVDQAIQGRATGVFILNTDGSPGGNTLIRIRGSNSINGGNDPLIIVDGLQGANINQLNPNDIESMEILKDASATAIYGSRGANGVILITTKLGKTGKPVIEAGYSIGFQTLAHKLDVMDAGSFAEYNNWYHSFDTQDGQTPKYYFTQTEIDNYKKNGGTDWQDEIYDVGVMQTSNLAISGATDRLKYMVSTGYLDHQGILLNSGYNRLSLRANLAADITRWVDFGLNYSYTSERYKSPPFNANLFTAVNNAPRWAPTEPVYDEFGNYARHRPGYGAYDTWNPVATALETLIENPTYQNNINMFLNFKIAKGLTLKIMGGGTFANEYNNKYENTKTRNGYAMNGVGSVSNSFSNMYQNTNILTYDKTTGIHHITVTGVAEEIFSSWFGNSMNGQDFLVDQLGTDNMDGAKSVSVDSWRGERALVSFMGRINYGLMDKYLLTLSYRADGSSVFGENNKWGYFPSGSLAWRISQEGFLQDSEVITDLKLRISYGVTGNQGISPYGSLARLGSGESYRYPYMNGQNLNIGFGIAGIANPDLKWESTAQSNIGVDVSLFKGRLISTIDVYRKVTEDLLMPRQLPDYVGVSSVIDNIGSIENRGLEIMIGGDPVVGNFRWNTSLNFTMNRNEVLDLGEGTKRIGYTPTSGGYSLGSSYMFLEVGQPFGQMRGYKFLGLWRADEDAEARAYGQLPGLPKYADLTGPNGVPDGIVNELDKTTIGYGYPDFTIGWNNLFTYKNFELSFLVTGAYGADLFNTIRIRRQTYEGNDPILWDYWTPQNQDTDIPARYDGAWVQSQNLVNKYLLGSSEGASSRWVEDASFTRLKTLTLAYNFQPSILQKIGFSKARLFFTGTNLITLTKYTGYDPEIAQFPTNDATIGVDQSVYPTARMYTFGADFTF
ncbi:MAG TPA: SusC/RagA family TonB-linked outer membrane protein [Bacteroidales bacterium]|nr:SusC/RagA family TonB-linked outer membrane protein [Bacteroidales bacterium]